MGSDDHLVLELVDDDGETSTCHAASENLVFRRNARPVVVAPDSICCLTEDGHPVSNTELPAVGSRLVFVAVESRRILRESPHLRRVLRRLTHEVGYSGEHIPF